MSAFLLLVDVVFHLLIQNHQALIHRHWVAQTSASSPKISNMKNTFTLLFAVGITLTIHAQTFTSQSFLNPTFPSVTIGNMDYIDLSAATGQNQTWDLSTLDPFNQVQQEVVPVASGLGNDDFTGANFALNLSLDGLPATLYFDVSANAVEEMGFYSEEAGYAFSQQFSNYKRYFTFPLSFGSSGSDTFEGEFQLPGGVVQVISGEIDYEIVGSGSIITNAGTFNNALMVRTNETSTTTIEVTGMQFQTTTVSEAFDFLVEGFPMAIASMESWTSTGQNGVESDQEGYTLLAAETNIPSIGISRVSMYPNPARDFLNITLADISEDVQITILDLSGKSVLSQVINDKQARLKLDSLGSGVYVVLVQLGDVVLRERLVVE